MSEHSEEPQSFLDSVMEKISDKMPGHDSSSSDSDNEKSTISSSVNRLFGRQKPVHKLFGGGKSADVLLWRNKQISAGVLAGATVIWLLFEWLGYYLLTLICHVLILGMAILFLWSNASAFINKSPPHIPQISFSEELFQNVASALRFEINRCFAVLHDVASGRDLKKFLMVVAGLWILSVIGSWANFLTLFYIAFVFAHTVPVLYEKYEDQVDSFAHKAMDEMKKHYRTFDAKVLSKIPRGPLKDKKF
eukprot:Gb_10741 [translate_table: standard]